MSTMVKEHPSQKLKKDRFADSRGMRHYVCYHNEEKMGYSHQEADEFSVGTSKKVDRIIGNKVWIIAGIGRPREYYLCSWFVADYTEETDDDYFKYVVYGLDHTQRGTLDPVIKLNDLPWFKEFLKSQSNFSFGLRVIDPKFASRFEELIKTKYKVKRSKSKTPSIESGTSAPLEKRLVEKRAIELIIEKYKSTGWVVKSVENEKRGFDLLCQKGKKEEHVEVKGLSNSEIVFTLTAREYQYASKESRFRVCIVTDALTKSPRIHNLSFDRLISDFRIYPIAYRCESKK